MAILPAQAIRVLCNSETPLIAPFNERQAANGMTWGLGPCTYDFRLAQRRVMMPFWQLPLWWAYRVIDFAFFMIGFPEPFADYYCVFAIGSTMERVQFPLDVCGVVLDKSSWARRGLAVQNTKFDPAFQGYPTVELSNHSLRTLVIAKGTPICQFKFDRLEAPTELPYSGRYQNQANAPTPYKPAVGAWE